MVPTDSRGQEWVAPYSLCKCHMYLSTCFCMIVGNIIEFVDEEENDYCLLWMIKKKEQFKRNGKRNGSIKENHWKPQKQKVTVYKY